MIENKESIKEFLESDEPKEMLNNFGILLYFLTLFSGMFLTAILTAIIFGAFHIRGEFGFCAGGFLFFVVFSIPLIFLFRKVKFLLPKD